MNQRHAHQDRYSEEAKAADPALSPIAYQPAFNIKKDRSLKQELRKRRLSLSKTAFIMNDKEFIILERILPARKKYKEDHEYSYLYIPFQRITGVSLKAFDKEGYLYILELKVKDQRFSYMIENSNKKMLVLYHKLHDFNRIA